MTSSHSLEQRYDTAPTAATALSRMLHGKRRGLMLLIEAYDYAREMHTDVWGFAVELRTLRKAGMAPNDVRCLLLLNYLEHALELHLPSGCGRSFQHLQQLAFNRGSCFILTEAGAAFLRRHLEEGEEGGGSAVGSLTKSTPQVKEIVPRWDRDRLELRLDHLIVKQFRAPAANQETILAALEEEGWPVRIYDPLPPHPNQEPRRRLHDTIHSLNRNQKNKLIRFEGDGTGQGVRWSLASSPDKLRQVTTRANAR